MPYIHMILPSTSKQLFISRRTNYNLLAEALWTKMENERGFGQGFRVADSTPIFLPKRERNHSELARWRAKATYIICRFHAPSVCYWQNTACYAYITAVTAVADGMT